MHVPLTHMAVPGQFLVLAALGLFYFGGVIQAYNFFVARAARRLGGVFVRAPGWGGLFSIGGIDLQKGRHECTVRYRIAGKRYCTEIRMGASYRGVPVMLSSRFFGGYPGWRHISSIGPRTERLFFTTVQLRNARVPLTEEQQRSVCALFDPVATGITTGQLSVEKGDITLSQTGAVYIMSGAVCRATRLQHAADLLEELVRQVDRKNERG